MKTRTHRIPGVVSICVAPLVKVAAALYAIQYCRAAQQDERNSFPFTAAVEWQKAAVLFGMVAPRLADRCWREWERIMRIPRRLAGPLEATPESSRSSYTRKSLCVVQIGSSVSLKLAA